MENPELEIVFQFADAAAADDMLRRFAQQLGYQEQIEDPENPGQMIDNPESRAEFNKRHIVEYVRSHAEQHRMQELWRNEQTQIDSRRSVLRQQAKDESDQKTQAAATEVVIREGGA